MHGSQAPPLRAIEAYSYPVPLPPECTLRDSQDLTFSIPSNQKKGETAYLLKSASGSFSGGQLVALLGPSGSGKTVGICGTTGTK